MILKYDEFIGNQINESKLTENLLLKKLANGATHNIKKYLGMEEYFDVETNGKVVVVKVSAVEDEKLSNCTKNVTIAVSMQNGKPVAMYCDESCIDYKELTIDKFEYVIDEKELEKCKQLFDDFKEDEPKMIKLILILNY